MPFTTFAFGNDKGVISRHCTCRLRAKCTHTYTVCASLRGVCSSDASERAMVRMQYYTLVTITIIICYVACFIFIRIELWCSCVYAIVNLNSLNLSVHFLVQLSFVTSYHGSCALKAVINLP